MKPFKACLLSLATLLAPALCLALPIDCNIFFDGTNTIQVAWNAAPGKTYLLQTTTNLSQPWQNALPSPGTVVATNSQIYQPLPVNSAARFFKIIRLDTEGPEIYQVSPLDGTIAVGQQAVLQAWLRDETGINTNSLTLKIGTNAAVKLTDPRLKYLGGVLTYTPGTNQTHDPLGSNVTVSVSAADTLGNQTTNFTWAFQLALLTVPATNILFLGGTNGLVLTSTNGDYFTYSYTPPFPGLTNGQQLVNTNFQTGYTRTVVAFTNYPASNTVVVLTRPTKPAELLQLGSLVAANFIELSNSSSAAATFGLSGATRSQPQPRFPVSRTIDLQRVLYQDGNLLLELLPGSSLTLAVDLDFQANFDGLKLRQFAATLSGSADFTLDAHAQATGAIDRSAITGLITPVHKFYATLIGGVPVWVELVLEVNAGYNFHVEAQADLTAGINATKAIVAGRRWDKTTGWTTFVQNPPAGFSVLGPTWQVEVSGNLRVYLQPKLTLYLYSVAGVAGDLQPYAELEGHLQLNPGDCPELSLYAGLSSTIGLDLRGWDDSWGNLPNITFDLIPRALMGRETGAFGPAQITDQPKPQTLAVGQTASFSVHTCGSEPLSYRWQKNGLFLGDDSRVSGTRSATLQIINLQTYDAGDYRVLASNTQGSTNSQNASLTVLTNNMAFIPAGSFTMGNTFLPSEGYSDELPLHTVYVSSFFMDRYEVTKALWDDVYNWAITHGYSFEYGALGKAASHPAHSMTWYDAAKWCNARSEKEGRVPAYYTDAGLGVRYRSGQVAPYVNWGSGYRLPTEAEWEKAARGGAGGQRFPWADSDTISWSRVNYYAYPTGYAYDVNPTDGYHPTFAVGGTPYTSPVGYFAANGYGLYDMAGNVWEWCWDWYGSYSSGSQTDPRGAAAGSFRVLRGGSWGNGAIGCRTAFRDRSNPVNRNSFIGFRSVLPPGQ